MALTPLRRAGEPREVAGVAAMLAAPAGAYVTGQNLIVDGGTLVSDGNLLPLPALVPCNM